MKRYAIFGATGNSYYAGEQFLGFVEAENQKDAEDDGFCFLDGQCDCEEDHDDNEGMEFECTCYVVAKEVAASITRYDQNSEELMTEEEFYLNEAAETHRGIAVAYRRIDAIDAEIEKLTVQRFEMEQLIGKAKIRKSEALAKAAEERAKNSY